MDAYCHTAFSPAVQAAQIDNARLDTLVMVDTTGALVAVRRIC